MRKALTLLVVTTAVLSIAQPSKASSFRRLIIRFKPSTSNVVRQATIARNAAHAIASVREIGYDVVDYDSAIPMEAELASFRRDPNITNAEPDFSAHIAAGDPCLRQPCAGQTGQWATNMTASFGAWATTYTAASKQALPRVLVAVIDTKVDQTHPDFINASGSSSDEALGGQIDITDARDWIPSDRQAGWAQYHGTYVAGLVGASTGNGTGIASIGARATILPLTVVDGNGSADAASLADAIVYAWEQGARVINLSLGLTQDSSAVHDAIIHVTQGLHPALVVAAAGNNTGSNAFYPGSYPEVMSVAGTAPSDQSASCSNHNANVSVSAPAEHVVSLSYGGGYAAPRCGTSAAAPQVSGLAADLIGQDFTRTPRDIRHIIESTADHLGSRGRNDSFGFGRINADRALHLGAATTSDVAATPPVNSVTTISAIASSPVSIRAARAFVDSIESTPLPMKATDGSWDSNIESLSGSFSIPSSLTAGPHPIFVEAFDGSVWGPASVGVLFVPGHPPVITNVSATNGVRATGTPVSVSFTITDEMPYNVNFGIQIYDATNKEVFRAFASNVAQGEESYEWNPSLSVLPGNYKVKIIAADATGGSSATMTGTVVA